jgi:hypothetical protein
VQFVRALAAQVLWWACAAGALSLALGALLVAMRADTSVAWVAWVADGADLLGAGVFSPRDGVLVFEGEWGRVHAALANAALGALCWLLAGWLLQRLVRPT